MLQIIQDLKNGDTILETVPAPAVQEGCVLIRTVRSLVSLGTERMLVDFGKAGWINKARQQPERLKMVLDKIKTDGLKPTLNAVYNKLAQPLPLGYSNAGIVIAVGKNVHGFKTGDRVVSNGPHAEIVSVPQNLVTHIPDNVKDDEAAFTVVGAIGLQSIRLVQPSFGETVVVTGLGLIGQLTAQLLKANGCRVIGVDIDTAKLELAKNKGIETVLAGDAESYIQSVTNYTGADAVIITAASKSNDIIAQAAKMCRKRGRIVLTGVIGLSLSRADFYENEISFQVSCSYGPGRYDADYEKGNDYPIGFVRWTAQRNFDAVLQSISAKQVDVSPLISARIPLEKYKDIYDNLSDSNIIAALLEYPDSKEYAQTIQYKSRSFSGNKAVFGIIGAGNFTNAFVLPALKDAKANIKTIVSANGLSAAALARKFEVAGVSTDYPSVLSDADIDTVVITTRHNLHAQMAVAALNAGKHVFVEKPLAINTAELNNIITAYEQNNTTLTVGFNRRFAPLAVKAKQLLGNDPQPVQIIATVNAGFIPLNNWIHDAAIGGGRIVGEACHFIDLCSFLCGSDVISVCANAMGNTSDVSTDNVTILLRYANGTNATIHYFANGSKAYDKERIEVYSQERTLILENWKKLTGYGFKGFSSSSSTQNKGHYEQFRLFTERIKNGGAPIIPFNSLINTSRATLAVLDSLAGNCWVNV